jgi:metal-responsive CopG/Arc/MetJ family transcriptional regulator
MSRRKTSVSVDDKLWREWIDFVVHETGSTRKISEWTEDAIRDYMQKKKEAKK